MRMNGGVQIVIISDGMRSEVLQLYLLLYE